MILPMKFRAVLFDAAETLFTTRGSVGEIYGSIAREYGSQAAPEVIQAAFVRHFRGAGPISIENQKQWWRDVVFRVSQGWILFPETREVLEELKRRGLKIGVISNFDDRIHSVMRSLDILSYFDSITISSETGFCKPDRQIFDAAVRALGVPASSILLVGDSLRDDVEAGARAGLGAVLMDRSGRYAAVEVPRISSLKEVLSFL